MIEYRLLGPVEVGADQHALDIGGHKQRVLLAVLLLSANEPVSRDVLIDRLWGEHPPAGAQHTLEVYVSRLRKALEPAAGGQVLLTRPGGYLLQVAAERIDVCRFERLVEQGRGKLAASAPRQAASSLRAALRLWRGCALGDLSGEPFAQLESARLEELRLGAVEDRIEADLALGRHAAVVSELEALAAEHPLRERLHGQLMIALYRSGRQADALEAYQSARRILVEELGVEPGPALQRVETAILQHDAALDPPGAAPPGQPPDRQPPDSRPPAAGPGRPQPAGTGVRHKKTLLAAATALVLTIGLLVTAATRGSAHVTSGPDTVGVIDAAQAELSAVVTGVGRPGGAAYGAGATWISDGSDDQLLRVAADHQVDDRIPVGRDPAGVAVGGGQIWVADALASTVTEVNPRAGVQVATIRVGNGPSAVAFGFGSVWVANVTDGTLSRIDPGSDRVIATIPLGSPPAGIAVGARGVWVTSGETGRLLLVDPARDRVSAVLATGGLAGGVAVGAGSVWVADTDGKLWRLDPVTGRTQDIQLSGELGGIAYADGDVWVANARAGSVLRVDPRTRSVAAVHVGNQPADLAAAGQDVVATVLPSLASHRGGTLTLIGQVYLTDQSADPAVAYQLPLWDMLSITNDGLVGYARVGGPAGNSLVPDLATALPVPGDGGRTYRFRLRPGIRYSNGVLVRPGDFRREIERVFAIDRGGGPAAFYTGIVGGVRCEQAPVRCDLRHGIVTDDAAGTVTFHLVAPDPEFLHKLAFPFADAVPAGTPARAVASGRLPATGPYMTQSYLPNHHWVLVRNPRFREWSAEAQPPGYPDRIVLRFGVPPGQAVHAVQDGQADVLLSPPADHLHELATQHTSQLHAGPLAATIGLVLNTRAWPFTVLAARRAVNFAVDRSRMIGLLGGPLLGQPTCQILPPDFPSYQPYCRYTLDPGPGGAWAAPDLAKAEQLVSASGTRGAKVTVLTGGFGTAIPVRATGRYLVSVLDQLGYHASLRVIGNATAYANQLFDSRHHAQLGWFGWYADYPAPWDFIGPLLTCSSFRPGNPGNLNAAEFCDPDIDAQASQALAAQARSPNAAGQLWTRIDHELSDQAAWVPLWNPSALILFGTRVGNYQYHPYWTLLIDQLWVR
ncbi:MAG TPA: BTAD domain-containing putative transcriptional regulator [Streptosporangiaceae bacterium]